MSLKTIVATFTLAGILMGCTSDVQITREDKALSNSNAVILINPFEVPEDKLSETISMWEQARDFLQEQPGYISTELHQSMTPDARFKLINVAKWESMETFQMATKKMKAEANLPKIEGVKANPALYTVVKRD